MANVPRPTPLTHMLEPTERGSVKGRCIICGMETSEGIPTRRMPSTFTDWWRVGAGNVVCPHCWRFLRDPQFRRRSWVLRPGTVEFLRSRKDAHKHIVNPPDPPFAIYIAIRGHKHGWIPCIHTGVNWSKDVITVCTEEGTITFNTNDYIMLHNLVTTLLKRGAKKTWMQGPTPNPRIYTIAEPKEARILEEWLGTKLLRLVLLLA